MIKNVVFMGTPEFAIPSLEGLIHSEYKPILVVSQPDKPKGRNQKLAYTAVKEVALKNDIQCYQPEDVNSIDSVEHIRSFKPDIIITVAYGAFLGKELRTMCPFGIINLHPSLLPLYRGADPVRSTLLHGDEYCGITVFFIAAKMDSGNIITQTKYNIGSIFGDRLVKFTDLERYLANEGANEIINAVNKLSISQLRYSELKNSFQKQNHTLATISSKLEKNTCVANFELSVDEFVKKIFAYSNEPGYCCYFRGKRIKLLAASINNRCVNDEYPKIKQIHKKEGFVLSLKDGDLLIKEVQFEGKKQMSAYEFHIGARLEEGEMFHSEI